MSTPVSVAPLHTRVRRLSLSLDAITWDSWWHGLRQASRQTVRGRFTIAKAQRLIDYTATTPAWRQVAVVVLFPVPGLLASLLAPLIPLQDPLLGASRNQGFFLHALLTTTFTLLGATTQAREVTGISHHDISSVEIVAIALVGTAHLIALIAVPCFLWRFPVPFSWVLSYVPWMACFMWGHVVVLRGRLLQSSKLRNRLLLYIPLLSLQVSQVVLYPAYSAVFGASGYYEQLALIALFPFLKYFLKRSIFLVSHYFHDFAMEESVCSVEISASMYQSMIMQTTPSPLAIALVMAIDVVIGVASVKRFMDRSFVIPRTEIVASAFAVLQDHTKAMTEDDLTTFGTPRRSKTVQDAMTKSMRRLGLGSGAAVSIQPLQSPRIEAIAPSPRIAPAIATTAVPRMTLTGLPSPTATFKTRALISAVATERRVVTQALEVLQSAESILLVEYLEVIVPIVNVLYVVVASQLSSAIYNPKIRPFYGDPIALRAAVSSVLLYVLLQTMTLLAMCVVMRVRFRLSALTLLAFLIEGRAWSLQGKMLSWVPFTFAFSVLHYGVDFSFQFDFSIPPKS